MEKVTIMIDVIEYVNLHSHLLNTIFIIIYLFYIFPLINTGNFMQIVLNDEKKTLTYILHAIV